MASKSADIRPGITLACTECKELKKFCSRCGKQTVHRETR